MPDIMKMGKNPNYLGSWDLDELPSREVTLTIKSIVDEEIIINGKSEICTVVYWTEGTYKPMIINVTNKKTLCRLYKTKDTEKLSGNMVVIGIDKVHAFGNIYDALRIRPRIPPLKNIAVPKCEHCGADIRSSSNMSAQQVAAYVNKKYGKHLCTKCATDVSKGAQK